ncbi:carbohydrate kinase, partial [Micromonospora globispora]
RGLGFGTTAVDILAGLMTGLCRMVADDLAVLESTVEQPTEVVLGGGAVAGSVWWRQAFAAAFAPRPVWHQRNPEIGATGAALVALGRFAEAAQLGGISRTDEPNPPNPVAGSPPQ